MSQIPAAQKIVHVEPLSGEFPEVIVPMYLPVHQATSPDGRFIVSLMANVWR